MTAKRCLLYAKDKFKTISDAWSHSVFLLSYSCYAPNDYESKDFSVEIEELFKDFQKFGFIYLNDKDNWQFASKTIEEGLKIIKATMV